MENGTVFSNNITTILYFLDGLRWTSQMKMEKLKRSLSFRKKKDPVPECSKPHQWLEDERKVREGTCSFQVRYLGCIEVYESRGMQVCEEAVKSLKNQCKGRYQRAILYVSGDALRVVDEISKSMIVDQTIEKVSFCAPDRNHDKGFAYICRDGTTRRWICHGFMAIKESGERLSHAVGCAFAICLERKQKRDKESGVNVTYNQDRTSFTRTGSFRQASITERIADPQSAILAGNTLNDPIPVKKVDNPYAVQRPHATQSLLQRQGSFRGFEKLHETSSPFKRSVSLRLSDLPSTLKRQNAVLESPPNVGVGSPIPELSPTEENPDSVAQMCQQLSQGLRALNTDDPFASVPHSTLQSLHCPASGAINTGASFQQSPTHMFSNPAHQSIQGFSSKACDLKSGEVSNPWGGSHTWAAPVAGVPPSSSASSSYTNPFLSNSVNGVPFGNNDRLQASTSTSTSTSSQLVTPRAPQLVQLRSHSIDSGELITASRQQGHKLTLQDLANQQRNFRHNNGNIGNGWGVSVDAGSGGSSSSSSKGTSSSSVTPPLSNKAGMSSSTLSALSSSGTTSKVGSKDSGPHVDPFDVTWASKAASLNANNPFQGSQASQPSTQSAQVKTFKVQL